MEGGVRHEKSKAETDRVRREVKGALKAAISCKGGGVPDLYKKEARECAEIFTCVKNEETWVSLDYRLS